MSRSGNGDGQPRGHRANSRSAARETAPAEAHVARVGMLEWFRPGEEQRVERVLSDLKALRINQLRTGFSWADWHTPEGRAFYEWLLPRLSRDVSVLPCFVYTPPSLGIAPKTSSPPKDIKAYADFLDDVITRLGSHFEWMELWSPTPPASSATPSSLRLISRSPISQPSWP